MMYDKNTPKNVRALLLKTIFFGGFCKRALTKINPVLKTEIVENTKKNKNKLLISSIFSFFSFF